MWPVITDGAQTVIKSEPFTPIHTAAHLKRAGKLANGPDMALGRVLDCSKFIRKLTEEGGVSSSKKKRKRVQSLDSFLRPVRQGRNAIAAVC